MSDPGGHGRWWRCFLDAGRGIVSVIRTERNFRVQLVLFAIAIGFGWFLGLSGTEWIALVLAGGLVLAVEAANTALEYLANALHPDTHPGVGRAKDAGAGAVLVASVAAGVVGAMLFLPKLWEIWTSGT